MLVHRYVDAGDTRHLSLHPRPRKKARQYIRKTSKDQITSLIWRPLALALLVPGVGGTNDVDDAAAPHDFAVLANLFDRRTNFHFSAPMPRRLAFFMGPWYCCDIMCDEACATKSMTPTTMINNEVPPN